ncbi:MAG: DUF2721 domain-containing protein [Gallionellaceae bacterium]|nr:DUF2721 domain-containing protein [Gallionellaceae bacterium]
MASSPEIITIAHVIQQAVAPVFLLTGVGALLTVLTNRLARVTDRLRTLEQTTNLDQHKDEILTLKSRAHVTRWAIVLCTISALFVCLVVAALFVSSQFGLDPSGMIALLFVVAMLALISGLLCFLHEITLAMREMGN